MRDTPTDTSIAFIEAKVPDMQRIGQLLHVCRTENQWANRGPLYHMLANRYSEWFNLPADRAVLPCANGGIGLEAMARHQAVSAGRKLRWVASAFSFANLGRGYFTDMRFVDCDDRGMLDLAALRALDPDTYDGIVVVNPFGLARDFTGYVEFAGQNDKALLIDNAAGVDRDIPDWPWQSFSLHHTKPYGAGEGGLIVVPAEAAEAIYGLIDYGARPSDPAAWLNNGKLSDIACAFQIDRLERAPDWAPLYLEQAARVRRIATGLGLQPLLGDDRSPPATSWMYLATDPVPLERLRQSTRLRLAKYYQPLAPIEAAPRAHALFARLFNIPTHPDVGGLSDGELEGAIAITALPVSVKRIE
ncbi:hypothetical protein HMH01_15175 [Halovulum dunhuangense]|uniref:dTDP-4-amino-4,6-dideoxygalactose transaminase n=1 Tax=Halovulum dunhuangense TaxID=1505036 RepID=A0A849L6T0_9RHOB|nr:DegT/DnrJ/EryC1/StrS family aminotransferase [Halovulum dunhuangense]NNU81781.1 hypothetical protein [Halovulum dunhuangense]